MTGPVRVWIVPVDVPPAVMARCRDVLDSGERARVAALASPRHRRQFTVAHGTLRILAGRELNTRPAALTWAAGPHGKPGLTAPWSGLHTSLSHSGDLIAAAVSTGRPVGIDIQHLVPGLDTAGLSARFFPPDEARYVAAGGSRSAQADRFTHLWARKEAVVKAAGSRLWPNLGVAVRHREVASCAEPAGQYRLADTAAPAGFRAAVALAGRAPFIIDNSFWPDVLMAQKMAENKP